MSEAGTETDHLARMFIGCLWLFFGIAIGSFISELGYSDVVGFTLGMVAVPFGLAAIYILGTVAVWIGKTLNLKEAFE